MLAVSLLLLSGCESREERRARCLGPLNTLVAWRDQLELEPKGKPALTPADVASQEKQQVEKTVSTLQPEQVDCKDSWTMMLMEKPSTPPRRLREEAILFLLGQQPHDYSPKAVGYAGVTVAGRAPVEEE